MRVLMNQSNWRVGFIFGYLLINQSFLFNFQPCQIQFFHSVFLLLNHITHEFLFFYLLILIGSNQ